MEIKRPKIKSMKYEDFNDNEYLEQMVRELRENGTHVVAGCLDEVINWGRSNSLWPLTFATSCCGIEFMAVGAARYDFARFGFEVARASRARPTSSWSPEPSRTRWLRCSGVFTTRWPIPNT